LGLFGRRAGSKASRQATGSFSLDEFVDGSKGREATPLELARDPSSWQKKLAETLKRDQPQQRELALPAFTLLRGGDLFERTRPPPHTEPQAVDTYAAERIQLRSNGADAEVEGAAMQGILRVVAGNPAVCMRMLLAKPIEVSLIPPRDDFRRFGFPRHTNPNAAGIFYNGDDRPTALIGLRQELVVAKPWLMVHEMTHAVHLMGMTKKEREHIDEFLMPVYRSRRWVEEAVAIYAERAFGAEYGPGELNAPGLYGKTRRDWHDRSVFSLFTAELFRPR